MATPVQSQTNSDAGSAFPAFGSAVTIHNAITIVARLSNNTVEITGFSDGLGNTYTRALRLVAGSSGTWGALEIWYALDIAAGTCTPTPTWSGANPGTRMRMAEWAGLALTNALDQIQSATGSGTTWNSGTIPQATAQANELIIGGFAAESYQTSGQTVGANFTFYPTNDVNRTYQEYRAVTATGSYSADMQGANGGNWIAGIATFKDATAGGGSPLAVMLGEPMIGSSVF